MDGAVRNLEINIEAKGSAVSSWTKVWVREQTGNTVRDWRALGADEIRKFAGIALFLLIQNGLLQMLEKAPAVDIK